ncbi:MAG: Aspartate--tRNA(Asp/Asn) ligase [Chlamydiales bacterium]|nr:Aspartate--tRNA(Asp/Asn) ligase [Chlamydiales bacterium]MCH9703688.1 aspartate--tRNA ligase [Chlamydiota bacterium]
MYSRSHNCGQLRKQDVDAKVTLTGWVHRRRDHGGLIFIDLRDRFGLTQIVFSPEKNPALHEEASNLRSEWVLRIEGVVIPRGEGLENPKMATGQIEVEVEKMQIFSKAKTPPFSVCDEHIQVNEELRLTYRYLDIRRGEVMQNLVTRHEAMQKVRNYLSKEDFLEVSTPIMAKSTPEGARDYLVPSRVSPGSFYALPQSPQIFKQLLMISGADRYFQLSPSFRDEDLRADRQPEFTQIDMEMSFGDEKIFFPIIEGMMGELFGCKGPFRRMPHQEALERYGTDKPDLRFGMELVRIDDIAKRCDFAVFKNCPGVIKGICVPGGADCSRKKIEEFTSFVSKFGAHGLAWMKMTDEGLASNIVKFFDADLQNELIARLGAKTGDLLLFVASDEGVTNQALDHLRRHIAKERDMLGDEYAFVWITEFPLFGIDNETGDLTCEHNPFTMVYEEDIPLLDSEPLKVRSKAYDLVLNGYELGSGSQRIHDNNLQEKIFELLKLDEHAIKNRFGFFIEALQYGTPPSLGIGLGLDRIVMLLVGTENIRDVIAFPKTQRAADLMMDAPSPVEGEQLSELKIHIEVE